MQIIRTFAAVAVLLLIASSPCRAADVLKNVPDDALGFVLARNLAAVDQKAQTFIDNLQVEAISPLAFVQTVMQIREGVDTDGDLLLAALPPPTGGDWPQFCVWLPVADYDQFVSALGGASGQKITAVTIAGEDLLVARQGQWALVMDPDQRSRLEQMLDATPTPSQALSWASWIDTQDIAVVMLSDGLRNALEWATADDFANSVDPATSKVHEDDLFGPAEANDSAPRSPSQRQSPPSLVMQIQFMMRQWLTRSPKALEWAHDAQAIGLGLRLDDEGNAHAGLRATIGKVSASVFSIRPTIRQGEALSALDEGGEFIITAAGAMPPIFTSAAASAYVRSLVGEMKTVEQLAIDDTTLARFYQEVEQAAEMVKSLAVFARPGNEQDGVYTNSFLEVRVESADKFVDHAGEVMRLWNQMNREADHGTQLIFDVEAVPIGDRTAKQYSIDIAAADGAPALPEIRQAMEKLFGPGGKLRLFVVRVDDQTALLAAATPEQMTAALKTLALKQPHDWKREPTEITHKLLSREADLRLFLSPHGYTKWRARHMQAITGPVFGGPLMKEFPSSPPIGAAGGINDRELWAEVVVPVQTIRAMGIFRQPKGIRLQR